MVEIIIAAIIGAGLFFGGWAARDATKPTTVVNNIDTHTTVTTEQTTQVQNQQAQITVTVIDSRGVYTNFNISIRELSNIIRSFQTNTNYIIVQTNK